MMAEQKRLKERDWERKERERVRGDRCFSIALRNVVEF